MKKIIYLFLAGMSLVAPSLRADNNVDDIGAQNIQTDANANMFSVEFQGDFIGEAKICHPKHLGHVNFGLADLKLNTVVYYDECYNEGIAVGAEYTQVYLHWNNNPYFNERSLGVGSLSVAAFSERARGWLWKGQVDVNFDNVSHWDYQDYMNYDILAWGRYTYNEDIGLHLGFLAYTGMKIDRVYPVIGIDWTYDCNWKVSAVFPVDISVTYTIDEVWSVEGAARFISERHRVRKDEFVSQALWFYQTFGLEVGLNYNPTSNIAANIHVGSTTGGHLKIADRHYHHRHRLVLGAAPYAGAEANISF